MNFKIPFLFFFILALPINPVNADVLDVLENISQISVTSSTFNVGWDTNGTADTSTIIYRTTTATSNQTASTTHANRNSHTISISSLSFSTGYVYWLNSTNSTGTVLISAQQSFTTRGLLSSITDLVNELPALFAAIRGFVPELIVTMVFFGVGAMILAIFAAIALGIERAVTFKIGGFSK